MDLVIDASVALKWFVIEEDSAAAMELRLEHNLSAPDLLLMECRNALLNKVRRRVLAIDEARDLERQVHAIGIEIFPSVTHLPHAFQIALDLGETIYDCTYLAAALANDQLLLSADARFAAKVEASSIAPGRVQLLSAISRKV